jgi:hypothetical protein
MPATVAMLLAACGGGGSDGGDGSPAAVTISGTVQYEFVPPNANCQGLDFASTLVRPIRGATVQLVDASNTEFARTVSGDDGGYSFANVAANRDVRLRVRAELKKTGSPGWDVEVRDNVVDPNESNPPALADRPLYTIVSDFNPEPDGENWLGRQQLFERALRRAVCGTRYDLRGDAACTERRTDGLVCAA